MQSASFALTPTNPFLKPFKSTKQNPNPRFNPISLLPPLPPKSLRISSIHGHSALPSHGSLSPSRFRPWISVPSPDRVLRARNLTVRANSVPESAEENTKSSSTSQTLQLGTLFGPWYLFNIYFNIYNKQYLRKTLQMTVQEGVQMLKIKF